MPPDLRSLYPSSVGLRKPLHEADSEICKVRIGAPFPQPHPTLPGSTNAQPTDEPHPHPAPASGQTHGKYGNWSPAELGAHLGDAGVVV